MIGGRENDKLFARTRDMALFEKNCPFCKGTGYRMSRVFHAQLREEIANELYGGRCDSLYWLETLELADKIIEMVRDHDLDA